MKLSLTLTTALMLASPHLVAQTRDLRFARTRAVPVTFDEVEMPDSPRAAREAKITVGGTFRSSCERSIEANVESPDARTHYVRAVALSLTEYACAQVEREYVQTVSLGALVAGDHQLWVEDDRGTFAVRRFTVEP